ncbi:hypothetical protein INT46_010698 [Mucor plumbeus]|uniref:Uncharacterized protein n=1 Tax=Mucor plumbeus TaxID=97098 RepID=A0A8H7R1S8_9FUNG|nr:hypothetical protein INT46_010698 [Mucor plumbeus]
MELKIKKPTLETIEEDEQVIQQQVRIYSDNYLEHMMEDNTPIH